MHALQAAASLPVKMLPGSVGGHMAHVTVTMAVLDIGHHYVQKFLPIASVLLVTVTSGPPDPALPKSHTPYKAPGSWH
jgi:hypothetical protein